jgi:hypothetical protein
MSLKYECCSFYPTNIMSCWKVIYELAACNLHVGLLQRTPLRILCTPLSSTPLCVIYIVTRTPISRQESDNFRCYATRCKCNNRGRGVFYVVRIYPLLGNGCFLWVRLEAVQVVKNRIRGGGEREREWEWNMSSAVKEEGFGWRLIGIRRDCTRCQ